MKKIKKISLLLTVLFCMFLGCENDGHIPINSGAAIPLTISNPEVENLPGAARISYTVPNDKELLYIKAVYELKPGVFKEVKASYYASSILVDGFGDTREREVELFSVGRNGKLSEPIRVKIAPLTPPVESVFDSLVISEDWGGISFSFENDYEADMAFEVLVKDSLGIWITVDNFYTKRKRGVFASRGFEAEKRMFGVLVRDRWHNFSDTLIGEFTPWFEILLDKTKFKKVNLPTDYNIGYLKNELEGIWDNNHGLPDYVSTPGYGLPQWFTFDMGVVAKLSRIRIHLRTYANQYLYNSGAVKKSELWGSTNPNPDGSWDDSWFFLRECVSIKPSGLPIGQNSNEDLEYAKAGEEFNFEDSPEVRYIRWKVLENWGGVTHANIDEIYIYGQPVE